MSFFFKKINKKGQFLSRGFSVLELIVVLAIFAIMTTILISDIPNFQDKSSLDLTVSEVATYIRGAQVYGAAQKGGETGSVNSYGIHFDKDSSKFVLYKNTYDSNYPPEESYEIKGFKIAGFYVNKTGNPICGSSILNISYKSNALTETISTSLEPVVSNGAEINGFNFSDIKIKSSRTGGEACLRVYGNGQIANIGCGDFNTCP